MREVASCVAACVHVRLWNEHTKLCGESSEIDAATSNLMAHLQDEVKIDFAAVIAKKLALVAEFPRPTSFHTAHYARLLLGHTSLCVTLLAAAENYWVRRLWISLLLSSGADCATLLCCRPCGSLQKPHFLHGSTTCELFLTKTRSWLRLLVTERSGFCGSVPQLQIVGIKTRPRQTAPRFCFVRQH